eukprot:m.83181 g.83181  ORF g.83181 m.83181 type:complete len:479 (-) comp11180_c0_seq1:104-1540(-)
MERKKKTEGQTTFWWQTKSRRGRREETAMGCTSSKNAGDLEKSPPTKAAQAAQPSQKPAQAARQSQAVAVDHDVQDNKAFNRTASGKSIKSPISTTSDPLGRPPSTVRPPTHVVKAIAPEPEKRTSTLPANSTDNNPDATNAVMHIVQAGVLEAAHIIEEETKSGRGSAASGRASIQRRISSKGSFSIKKRPSQETEVINDSNKENTNTVDGPTPRRTAVRLGCTAEEVFWNEELCQEDPVEGLAAFLADNRVRTDAFYKVIDKDCNKEVTNDEFIERVLALGMPLDPEADRLKLEMLAKSINSESGTISYLDVSTMRKEYEKKVRDRRRANPDQAALQRGSSFHGAFKPMEFDNDSRASSRNSTSASRNSQRPTDLVREELKAQERERAEAREKHIERQQYLEARQSQKKRTPSKAKQQSFQERMSKARESTKIGPKRTHPFLDDGGVGATNRKSTRSSTRTSTATTNRTSTAAMQR